MSSRTLKQTTVVTGISVAGSWRYVISKVSSSPKPIDTCPQWRFMVQRIATFGTLGVSSFPWYTCNVHGVMMQVWRNYCELNVELQVRLPAMSLSVSRLMAGRKQKGYPYRPVPTIHR